MFKIGQLLRICFEENHDYYTFNVNNNDLIKVDSTKYDSFEENLCRVTCHRISDGKSVLYLNLSPEQYNTDDLSGKWFHSVPNSELAKLRISNNV